jgi:uncharacterized protein (DUF1499 family)
VAFSTRTRKYYQALLSDRVRPVRFVDDHEQKGKINSTVLFVGVSVRPVRFVDDHELKGKINSTVLFCGSQRTGRTRSDRRA